MRRRTLPVIALAAATALVACTEQDPDGQDGPDGTSAPPEPTAPEISEPQEARSVVGESDPATLALATSAALFAAAPVLVVAPADDEEAQARAASAAVALGMPMVLAQTPQEDEPAGGAAGDGEDGPAEEGESGDGGTGEDTTGEDEATSGSETGGDAGSEADAGSGATEDSTEAPQPSTDEAIVQEVQRLDAQAALVFGAVVSDGLDVEVVEAPADDDQLAQLLDVSTTEVEAEGPVRAVLDLEPGQLGLVPATAGTDEDAAGEDEGTGDGAAEGDAGADDGATAQDDAAPTPTEGTDDATPGESPGEAPQQLPATTPAEPLEDVLVLTTGERDQLAAVATARAAQADVEIIPEGDPRATSESVQTIAESDHGTVVGLGAAFGDAETLEWRVETAATGTELPGGGQRVLPGKTYVALYGNPTTGALGVLGEQGPEATIERARAHAAPYEDLTDTEVVPSLEIIATVASAFSGEDNNYSSERPIEELRPLVDLARENDQYVVLDLQPGRTDFVTQAQLYEELLREPHVGLALDPEWRLEPDEVHLRQIGQVDVAEVNEVVTWLADFVRENQLPQKMLILHQFQVRMIPGVEDVDTSRSELAVLIHADGQGSQPAKQDTWRVLRNHAPNVDHWGWKNFYDEDVPMLTPEQTMQVEPAPQFISYQ